MNQLSIFNNESREAPLKTRKAGIKRIVLKKNESKEFVTAKERIAIVTKKRGVISGVGKAEYFQICFDGQIIQPLTSKGVKQFLLRN